MDGEEGMEAGAMAGAEGALEGDGHMIDEEDAWYIADVDPERLGSRDRPDRAPLDDSAARRDRRRRRAPSLADEWIHAKDLVAIGIAAADE